MFNKIIIKSTSNFGILEFIQNNDYIVTKITESVIKVSRANELDVFINIKNDQLYFQIEIGNVSELNDDKIYYKLLDLNTEILPVSIGIDSCDENNPKLVIIESRS
jgi:uncharacterized protein YjfI (DUF2170 family)